MENRKEPEPIHIDDTKLSQLLCQAINQPNAYVESLSKNSYGGGIDYDVIISTGIAGNLHAEFMYQFKSDLLMPLAELNRYMHGFRTQIDAITLPNQRLLHVIIIKNIDVDLVTSTTKGSLFDCLQNYIAKNHIKKIDERDESSSRAIYSRLKSSEFINKFPNWETKTKGAMSGVILLGKTKHDQVKKVYVKDGSRFSDALDYGVFKIAKKCEVNMPKVKFQIVGNQCYLFSTAIDKPRAKQPDEIYRFMDINEYYINPNFYIDSEQVTISFNRKEDGSFAEVVQIDKISIAKLFLTFIIFGLYDLHLSNLGIVVSDNGNSKTAELSLVDFSVRDENNQFNDFNNYKDSFISLVKAYFSEMKYMDYQLFYLDMLNQLDENDFLQAFKSIEESFDTACQTVLPEVDVILKSIGKERKIDKKEVYCRQWKENFNAVKNLSHSITNKIEESAPKIGKY